MRLLFAAAFASLACAALAAPRTLVEWTFDRPEDLAGWTQAVNHVGDLKQEDGCLKGRIMDWDPWVTSPAFAVPAKTWQKVEFRLKTDLAGSGELFFTNTTESPYGGFFPNQRVAWKVNGDGQWHEYEIYPFWGELEKIIRLRLDFARADGDAKGNRHFELDWIRIVEVDDPPVLAQPPAWTFPADTAALKPGRGLQASPTAAGLVLRAETRDAWLESPFFSFSADDGVWVVVTMSATAGTQATFAWTAAGTTAWAEKAFAVIPDGKMRTYNVDLSAEKSWTGAICRVAFRPPVEEGVFTLSEFAVRDEPGGPAAPVVHYAGLQDAINRSGGPAVFLATVENRGGATLVGGRAVLDLPAGVRALGPAGWDQLPDLASFDRHELRVELQADAPAKGPFSFTLLGGADQVLYRDELEFTAPLNLPKADYVPVPQPVESDYEVGALYFPRWHVINEWEKIWTTDPQRKPVLGWYDEANPEVVDWQIKWAVENGIQFFLVDWYWHQGRVNLEHWIKAYEKARYRSYLKWCMMYANHNPKGSHSEEDQRAVTQYWIDNYFGMPEYYRIDDMPVVMYWSPSGLKRDMGGEPGGARKLLEISRQMAREAGYKGIYFITMKWPEASTEAKDIQWLADEGFDMTSLYHFMHHGGKAENPYRYPFKLVADCSDEWMRQRHATGILPFLPNLSTGWHSRPWHGERGIWIEDRNVPDFQRICQDARRFVDDTGIRRLTMAPLNEWGEGSYAEPNKEFGFGMYEAVRDAFAKKPAGGWPLNYTPADVGLGPYDLPMPPVRKNLTEWDFAGGPQGWGSLMGTADFKAEDGVLRFRTASSDPALQISLGRLRAADFRQLAVRMKMSPHPEGENDGAQLFWSTATASVSEPTSVKTSFKADGEFHEYLFDLAANPRWRGRITSFRLDPCNRSGATIEISDIRLVK